MTDELARLTEAEQSELINKETKLDKDLDKVFGPIAFGGCDATAD